jgi:hypothetical protein
MARSAPVDALDVDRARGCKREQQFGCRAVDAADFLLSPDDDAPLR